MSGLELLALRCDPVWWSVHVASSRPPTCAQSSGTPEKRTPEPLLHGLEGQSHRHRIDALRVRQKEPPNHCYMVREREDLWFNGSLSLRSRWSLGPWNPHARRGVLVPKGLGAPHGWQRPAPPVHGDFGSQTPWLWPDEPWCLGFKGWEHPGRKGLPGCSLGPQDHGCRV